MEKIKALSLERLKVVLDFIEYLEEKEEWEATLEVLKDKETMENIIKATDGKFLKEAERVARCLLYTSPSPRD